ncbi:hypothetical protein PVAP13_2NG460900 [Panicum virgatum]|uniref:Uncharacterized protein n=1 Tax=Panicum virgatum TaxID=38727 RepID=A0A8T0VSK0_PANVG|nr:hypothetical protein PVAP13_2NG460900 [Panicum virgatum]
MLQPRQVWAPLSMEAWSSSQLQEMINFHRSSIHGRANLQALVHDGALKAAAAESYCFCIPDVCRANGVLGRSSVRSP